MGDLRLGLACSPLGRRSCTPRAGEDAAAWSGYVALREDGQQLAPRAGGGWPIARRSVAVTSCPFPVAPGLLLALDDQRSPRLRAAQPTLYQLLSLAAGAAGAVPRVHRGCNKWLKFVVWSGRSAPTVDDRTQGQRVNVVVEADSHQILLRNLPFGPGNRLLGRSGENGEKAPST